LILKIREYALPDETTMNTKIVPLACFPRIQPNGTVLVPISRLLRQPIVSGELTGTTGKTVRDVWLWTLGPQATRLFVFLWPDENPGEPQMNSGQNV